MKKLLSLSLLLLLINLSKAKADEGMWLLPLLQQLNIETMNEMGLELSAEELFSINQSSLKDAIVIFGGGCTGEMISDQGLLLTNHHCGYGQIQELSTLENNYLDNGFWAASKEEELPAPGLKVTFMRHMEDVTNRVLEGVAEDMDHETRQKAIRANIDSITKAAAEGNDYEHLVRDYFAGNQYFLISYEEFTDVRFVGAPPSSIGKFGYDTDNWMWPRHTGDFSIFRVYAGHDGKPADYSPDNIPYQPLHHLPVSLQGVEMDDFAMTLGFPGSTQRYLPSWGIQERMNIFNQTLITVRGEKQDIWAEDMAASDKVRLQYATKFSRSSNYWKNSIGMNRGLEALDVLSQKRELEARFAEWAESSAANQERYGKVLATVKEAYTSRAPQYKASNYLRETLVNGTEIYRFAGGAKILENALEAGHQTAIDSAVSELRSAGEVFFKDYSAPTDQKVLAAMLARYAQDIENRFWPDFYTEVNKKYQGDYQKYAEKLFEKSLFTSQAAFEAFLAKPSLKKLRKDPAYQAGRSVRKQYNKLLGMNREAQQQIDNASRLFIAGLMEMQPDKVFYPDANFTMRLSYGTVGDYEPRDAVRYKHYTTLQGVMEKEDPDNFEFFVPERLKELHATTDYGRYGDKDGSLWVNFTTNNDITGGNSGSPVINGKGQLIGLAFDGNWEAMSGDIAFEPELQKCINVDIRYVLFIIDKYAGASHLIDEMTIVE
ncbi:S46 family peptidase [Geofilum rhodophaeum]|uniref:S46 family peptidase n=1 Tax=Geofilum rhodophaeum TaxID=1965019 RepID=UPI000B527BC4|nr:S46 family peptidase [Geofilum rhodophaeum]